MQELGKIYKYKISSSDKFLVFACDGLWDVLDNQEVVNIVLSEYYDINTGKKLNVKKNSVIIIFIGVSFKVSC